MLTVQIRSYLARHRRVHALLVVALALIAGAVVLHQVQRLERARAAWGTGTPVWVAARPLEPGEPFVLRTVTAPAAVVPPDAITEPPPAGSLAAQRLGVGEVVTSLDVAGGPGDLVPVGWRSVAVAVDERSLVVGVGDRVDVAADGVVLAAGGRVVAVSAASVAVAVPAEVAALVAAAALDQRAVVLGRGAGG